MQEFACAGPAGQGARLFRYVETPESTSITPANANNGILCSDSQTSCGTAVTMLARATPAPIDTSAAGSAQHMSVLNELTIVSISRIIVRKFIIFRA
jgi:hypothetical protein